MNDVRIKEKQRSEENRSIFGVKSGEQEVQSDRKQVKMNWVDYSFNASVEQLCEKTSNSSFLIFSNESERNTFVGHARGNI